MSRSLETMLVKMHLVALFTAKATDSDYQGQSSVKYSLQGSPAGLSINEDTGEVTLDESVDMRHKIRSPSPC